MTTKRSNSRHHPFSDSCLLCNRKETPQRMFPLSLLRPGLISHIRTHHPALAEEGQVCLDCLNRIRSEYVLKLMEEESGAVSRLEEETAKSLRENDTAARNIERVFREKVTVGERVADRVASFGGSWKFISLFGALLIVWMVINTTLLGRPFDPYPFILLNLILSCLAAIQAPIIMMSQNRQEAKDRLRSENDYRVNLKAELEIRHLHDKLDLLLHNQWEKLMEIQAIQTEMMEELARKNQ